MCTTKVWAHSQPWAGDREVEVSVGPSKVSGWLKKDRFHPDPVYESADSALGEVSIPGPGEYDVCVRTVRAGAQAYRQDLAALRFSEATRRKHK